jgi:TRAP-type mannitol/chloroaromatic compound transport system permease small subunit
MSEGLRRMLEVIARASGWLLVVMAAVTCFDVLARKIGLPVPLTRLQELEWHFHAALFSLWMGYGYTINAHPRVDSFTERLTLRQNAWIELAGCLLFALPYMALVAYHSLSFVAASYEVHEQSPSTVGLTHRWIIKGIYAAGLWLVVRGT